MKKFVLSFLCAAIGISAQAAAPGSYMGSAISLKASQAVKLVDEYDPDSGEYWGLGVRYYKVSLKKGMSYTIWITGGNAANMGLTVDTDYENENAPFASFDYDSNIDGSVQAAYLYSDSWFEDDPASGVYYICISGEIDDTTMLYYTAGIQSFVKEGEDGNPKRITVSDSAAKTAASKQDAAVVVSFS